MRVAKLWMLAGAVGAALASGCEQPMDDELRGEDDYDYEEPAGVSGEGDTEPGGIYGIDRNTGGE